MTAVLLMSAFIFVIYRIAKRVHFEVSKITLVLCAVLAVAVNFASIALSSYFTLDHMRVIIALVMLASAAVTLLNEYLVRGGRLSLPMMASTGGAGLAFADDDEQEDEQSSGDGAEAIVDEVTGSRDDGIPEPGDAHAAGSSDGGIGGAVEAHGDDSEDDFGDYGEDFAASVVNFNAIDTNDVNVGAGDNAEENDAAQPVSVNIPDDSGESGSGSQEKPAASDGAEVLQLTEVISRLDSLDDLLDYAFSQSNERHYRNAIFAYKKAIERYGNDEYAPFIVIELANVYKEIGAYDDAIRAYRHALTLPVLRGKDDMRNEFKKSISYLTVVSDILSQHGNEGTPFSKILPELRDEIERMYSGGQIANHRRNIQ